MGIAKQSSHPRGRSERAFSAGEMKTLTSGRRPGFGITRIAAHLGSSFDKKLSLGGGALASKTSRTAARLRGKFEVKSKATQHVSLTNLSCVVPFLFMQQSNKHDRSRGESSGTRRHICSLHLGRGHQDGVREARIGPNTRS